MAAKKATNGSAKRNATPNVRRIRRARSSGSKRLSPEAPNEPLAEFLQQLTSLLMNAGISAPAFNKLVNAAFCESAAAATRLANSRINNSAVAAMTGLSRVEVRSLLGTTRSPSGSSSRNRLGVERLVRAWREDPDFTTYRLRPRVLALGPGSGTFDELVKKFAGDLPVRAVMRDLLRRKIVEQTSRGLRLLPQGSQEAAHDVLRELSTTFGGLLHAASNGPIESRSLSHQRLKVQIQNPLVAKLLKRHLETVIPVFLESVKIAAEGARGLASSGAPNATALIEVISLLPH
jgi:hypothetical protein